MLGMHRRIVRGENDMSVTKIRGMASGCHLKYLHFW
jgi:hypothetical protein